MPQRVLPDGSRAETFEQLACEQQRHFAENEAAKVMSMEELVKALREYPKGYQLCLVMDLYADSYALLIDRT